MVEAYASLHPLWQIQSTNVKGKQHGVGPTPPSLPVPLQVHMALFYAANTHCEPRLLPGRRFVGKVLRYPKVSYQA